ncbi:hypothetical protein EDD86DRAFT_197573 [Gorgonomyces haynaldii]|nr:hypothetical protein EDD86DRAFT_197573 [Gorgonomyces haynaldii]
MTKRPVGLSARKAKKQKTEEELVLEVSGENEMEELDSLFQTAVEYLDTDPEQAKMLLRGCIHECDKMVRIRHGDIPNATEEEKQFLLESIKTMPILPQQFHLIYANALYYSSLVEDEALGFLDQSIDRAHIGLESQSEHTKELLHCLARSTIQKALISEEKQKVDDYKQSLESLLKQDYSETLGQLLLELAHFGVTYADKLEEKKERLSWLGYVMNAWEFVQRQSEDVQADIGVGNTWLVKADILMEDEEEKPIALLEHGRLVYSSHSVF